MTDYSTIDFSPLEAVADDEVVTHAFVKDVPLPSGKTLALVTLDNGRDHTRPNTMGPATLLELGRVFDQLTERAKRGEIDAVGVTGKPFILAAGADLSRVGDIPSVEVAKLLPAYGASVLFSDSQATTVEGTHSQINAIVLFPSRELALECYNSEKYQKIKNIRLSSVENSRFVLAVD